MFVSQETGNINTALELAINNEIDRFGINSDTTLS
jgi:hypothetical protein